jgi:pimeloyl-ACP methyl ester carboxylesterase
MTDEIAPPEDGNRIAWDTVLATAARERGYFEQISLEHKSLFLRGNSTLVVTFDNLDDARQSPDRMPWGVNFISSMGWSSLGIMAHGHTWYRDPALIRYFDELAEDRFFEGFEKVVFYGTSMGGYAAAAYSAASPGSTVIAVNPQATLERDRAGWETRFRPAWRRDFSGRYGFAPDSIRQARKMYLFYNPAIQADAMHASLFWGDNVHKIRCAHMGHGILSVWRQMGVLKKIVAGCVNDDISSLGLYQLLRARRVSPAWQKMMLEYLRKRRRHALVERFCMALPDNSDEVFQKALEDARRALGKG